MSESRSELLYCEGEERRENGDIAGAIELYKQALSASDNGHLASLLQLGGLYADSQDYASALQYFVSASSLGSTSAQTSLALIYEETDNIGESLDLFRKAVAAGDGEAHYQLGFKYLTGNHVEMDLDHAESQFKSGAELGDLYCMYHYSVMILEKDEGNVIGMQQLEEAHRGGVVDATYMLAGYTKDETRAYEQFLQSAELGNINGMLKVCLALQTGVGCTKDPIGMLEWLNTASENGSEVALALQNQLRNAQEQGTKVEDVHLNIEPQDEKPIHVRRKSSIANVQQIEEEVEEKKQPEEQLEPQPQPAEKPAEQPAKPAPQGGCCVIM